MATKSEPLAVENNNISTIYTNRVNFFIGVLIFLIFNLFLSIILYQILGTTPDQLSLDYLATLWIGNVIIALISGIISVFVINALLKQNGNSLAQESNQLTFKGLFASFRLRNFKHQLRDSLILICCVYVPLDFFSYLIPGVFEFSANSLMSNSLGQYLLWEFGLMVGATLLVHFCVSFREEFLFRNFYIAYGEKNMNRATAFIYSAILFGLAHFSYIFSPSAAGISAFFPIWWGFNALIIGIISGYYFQKYHRLWPLILAHWANNFISALVLRNFLLSRSFLESFLFYYIPFLIVGVVILCFTKPSILSHSKQITHLLSEYKKEISESSSRLTLLVDIVLIIIIWLLTTFTF